MVTSHAENLTGLAAGTTYHYKVQSGAGGVLSASADNVLTTLTSAPNPLSVSGTAVSRITASEATVTWTTNLPADSQVVYGPTAAYGSSTPLNSTLVTSHSVTLTGLTSGTTYHYKAQSGASGSTAASSDATFITAALSQQVVISNVVITRLSASSVTITWTTNVPSNSQVNYGRTSALGTWSPLQTALVPGHSIILNGLSPRTTYYYQVISGGTASGVYSFRTKRH